MKQTYKFAAGLVAALGLGIAVTAANAHPGQMGAGMGPHMQGGMQQGAMAGMQHGARGHVGMGGGAARYGAGPEVLTQEERSAMIERMHNAATPEERQKVIAENRAAMQKRAQETGVAQPAQRGPRAGHRHQAPATN